MSEVLLTRETIYAADIALIMDGKSAADVMDAMEKREEAAKEQERMDKVEAEIAILDTQLSQIMAHSKRFVDAKLASPERLIDLEKNFELARDVIRRGGQLKALPTLDNLENYAMLIKEPVTDGEDFYDEPDEQGETPASDAVTTKDSAPQSSPSDTENQKPKRTRKQPKKESE